MIYPIIRLFMSIILFIFVKDVYGLNNLPKKGPYIIASNHQSHLDGFLLASYIIRQTNQKVHFLAKKEFISYFGKTIEYLIYKNWAATIEVEKIGTKNKGKKAIKQSIILLKEGEIIGIFPEGKRTYDGSVLEGRTGIVRILQKANVPIIPIGINGAYILLPRNKIIPRIWRSRITIKIGKPFYITKLKKITKNSLRTSTTLIMKKIAKEAGVKYEH